MSSISDTQAAYLVFNETIIIPPQTPFYFNEFYESNKMSLFISEDLLDKLKNKNLKCYLDTEIELSKFLVKEYSSHNEIRSFFEKPTFIPIENFIAILKYLLEKSLIEKSGDSAFHIDLGSNNKDDFFRFTVFDIHYLIDEFQLKEDSFLMNQTFCLKYFFKQ